MRNTAWFTALIAYLTLLGVLVAWNAWIDPPERIPRILPLLVLGLPLLAMLRGLLHGRRKSFQLSALLALVYFSLGLIDIAGGVILYGWLQTVASVVWFVALLVYLKASPIKEKQKASVGVSTHIVLFTIIGNFYYKL